MNQKIVRNDRFSTIKDTAETNHILIEGDNLYAMQAIIKTCKNKINVIYIDPPYNTGHNDFIYDDKYVDHDIHKSKHDAWLSFMKPRLELAKDLLSDDGVIFVSIDEHEEAYLKILMDEIFNEDNFITTFSWIMPRHQIEDMNGAELPCLGANLGEFKNTHEYILAYKKSKQFHFSLVPSKEKTSISRITKAHDKVSTITLPKGTRCEQKTGVFTGIIGGKSEPIELLDDMIIKDYKLDKDVSMKASFACPLLVKRFFSESDVIDNRGQKILDVYITKTGLPYIKKEKKGNIISNTLSGFGDTSIASKKLADIIGKGKFNYPKPVDLIKTLLSISSQKDSIILDFFAGSGTTGQAVMELNSEDGGHRKAIMITNNQNGIAQDVASVRMHRVLTGKEWADDKQHEQLSRQSHLLSSCLICDIIENRKT